MQTIYLDHAATSFPKPHEVAKAMTRYVETVGATINRSIYGAALEAELTTLALREPVRTGRPVLRHPHCRRDNGAQSGNQRLSASG